MNLEKSRHVWWSTVSCVWRYNALVQKLLMYGSMSEQSCQYNGTSVITWVGTELPSCHIVKLWNQVTFISKPSKWQLWKIIDKPNIGLGNYVRHKNFALTLQLLHANNCLCCSLKRRTTKSTWKHLAWSSMVTDNWLCKRKLFLLCTYTKKSNFRLRKSILMLSCILISFLILGGIDPYR